MTTNLKHRADRKQEYETVVFQKNRYKVLTCVNPFEQNNDHTRISHEIEFRSSFNDKCSRATQLPVFYIIRALVATEVAIRRCFSK